MNKFVKAFVTAALSAGFVFGAAACGGKGNQGTGGGSGGSSGGSDLSGTVSFFVPMANVDNDALTAMANAYMDINRGVTVKLVTSTGSGYSEQVRALAATEDKSQVSIVRVSQISQYYGTDKVVDFTDYLEEENEYAEGSPSYDGTWKSVLEEDAYPIEGKAYTIPALSYESNYTVCFYDKRAMNALMDDPDYAPETWKDLLDLLEKAKNGGYKSPLGLSFTPSSCAGIFMGWFIKMYADQYFRDFIDKAHSKEGDYSYIAADKNWNYETGKNDPDFDRTGVYTSNLNRTIDTFFNNADFKVTSARFADMMKNFKDLAQYSSNMTDDRSTILGLDETTNYWNDQTGVGGSASGSSLLQKNVFLRPARLDSVFDYITRYALDKVQNNNGDVAGIISQRFGWFELPAMPGGTGTGAPAADNVRSLGGPVNELGIIDNGDKKAVEAAVDFLKFVLSPQGQNIRYETYVANGYTTVMPSLVKDCTIDPRIDQTTGRSYVSGCERNPINIFTLGYGDGDIKASGEGTMTLNNKVGELYSSYLQGSSGWDTVAAAVQKAIEDSFGEWAEYRGLKYSTFTTAAISDATNKMTENPVKDVQ